MIELHFPLALLLLPAPVLVWWLVPPYRQSVRSLRFPFFRRLVAAAEAEARGGSRVVARRMGQMIVAAVIWALLVLALARPERVGDPIEITKAARDVILAIDISGSMDERDFKTPDGQPLQRLAAVKAIVGDFVERREGDRVALIVFGTRAFVQAPFTEDLQTVRELLDQTEAGMAGPHTALGDALGLAIRTFQASKIDQRLLIVLSDGADTGSRMSPVNAAAIAAQNGVEIYTIAVGDPEGSGENRVDKQALQEIARRTGGQFFFAGDAGRLAEIYRRIEDLAPRKVETISFRPRESVGHWPLAIAAILALLTITVLHVTTRAEARA